MRRTFPDESRWFTDEATGRRIRQITVERATHHHPFFLVPAYDSAGNWLFFISHRTGRPEVFAEERQTRKLIQLTSIPDLNEWSLHPSWDGRRVYFTTSTGGYAVETSTQRVEKLLDFGEAYSRGQGMVAAGMGTTALSRCGRYWALKFVEEDEARLKIYDVQDGALSTVTTHDTIAHLQFSPDDSDLLHFSGNFKERVWTIRRDGSEKRLHYMPNPGEWITHESWLPGTRELMFVDWPNAVRTVNIDTGALRTVVSTNAWHPIADATGKYLVADTNAPDKGIIFVHTRGPIGEPTLICLSTSSNAGSHWHGPFPYENGPIAVHAPQETHPHPRFAPDNGHIVFTSDRSGVSQIYEVDIRDLRAH